MSIKHKKITAQRLSQQYHLMYEPTFGDFLTLYQAIFNSLPEKKIHLEMLKAWYRPTFLKVQNIDGVQTGIFTNNYVLLWAIISQHPLPSSIATTPLSLFEVNEEMINNNTLVVETLDLIARHSRILPCHELYQSFRSLVTDEQCYRLFHKPKLTQNLFYSLIDVPLSTVHRKKNSQLKQEHHD